MVNFVYLHMEHRLQLFFSSLSLFLNLSEFLQEFLQNVQCVWNIGYLNSKTRTLDLSAYFMRHIKEFIAALLQSIVCIERFTKKKKLIFWFMLVYFGIILFNISVTLAKNCYEFNVNLSQETESESAAQSSLSPNLIIRQCLMCLGVSHFPKALILQNWRLILLIFYEFPKYRNCVRK